MQIIIKRFILGKSLLEDVLARERRQNEERIIAIHKQGFKVKALFRGKDPAGLKIRLGDFRIDRSLAELKFSSWGKFPQEIIPHESEFHFECREYAPSRNENKIYCKVNGEELDEDFDQGSNYASYLTHNEAVEVAIKNFDYLKMRKCFIELSPQGDSVRIVKELMWKGPISRHPKQIPQYSLYVPTVERCYQNLQSNKQPATENIRVAAAT
ncbi:MAG TPA: hypothetical protein VIH31_00280 [Candidatus Paceibacterota bacterium]